MQNLERLSLAEMKELIEGSRAVRFDAHEQRDVYDLVERVLRAQRYTRLSKGQRGIVRRYLVKVTGLSRAQITRLIGQWMSERKIQARPPRRPRFMRRYTVEDIALLASVDAAHEDLSGPAMKHICEREHEVFGKAEFARLAGISVSHLYNLRVSPTYAKHRVRRHATQARQVSIGERRKPDPKGKPGYVRVDTVHQGQRDGKPGIYHLNAVDTVTQWEVVGCVETICERHLLPVLEAMLHQFPFRILGFHCDNGSEFVNGQVAELLNKLLVEFTKSRAYKTTDNALVEGKNGAVVRKHTVRAFRIGYGAIGSEHAEAFQKFYTAYLNPYLNYHRPCGFATVTMGARGRRRRVYRAEDYQTPYEKLQSLSNWEQYLKLGIRARTLELQAKRMSDTEAAQQMQKAKCALLAQCRIARQVG